MVTFAGFLLSTNESLMVIFSYLVGKLVMASFFLATKYHRFEMLTGAMFRLSLVIRRVHTCVLSVPYPARI
jgi:hypothetical protein